MHTSTALLNYNFSDESGLSNIVNVSGLRETLILVGQICNNGKLIKFPKMKPVISNIPKFAVDEIAMIALAQGNSKLNPFDFGQSAWPITQIPQQTRIWWPRAWHTSISKPTKILNIFCKKSTGVQHLKASVKPEMEYALQKWSGEIIVPSLFNYCMSASISYQNEWWRPYAYMDYNPIPQELLTPMRKNYLVTSRISASIFGSLVEYVPS